MTKARRSGETAAWDRELVTQEKRHVRGLLDAHPDAGTPRGRLDAALQLVKGFEADATPLGRLRCYISIVSALVQHEQTGALTAAQVDALFHLAYSILRVQRVEPRTSRLAALYGDLHMVRSQIFRKQGEPWRAAWEQQIALQLGGKEPSGGMAFQRLCMANRAFRLGHAGEALEQYRDAEQLGLAPAHAPRCRMELLKCLWLAGEDDELDALVADTRARGEWPDELRLELDWLEIVRTAQVTRDFRPLLAAIRRGRPHYGSTYIIETTYWLLAVEERVEAERLPSMAYLARVPELDPRQFGAWYEGAKTLQACYDQRVPLHFRIRDIGESLLARQSLVSVDKELLLLATATRWLSRVRSSELARLVMAEYQLLSQRITGGRSEDALRVLAGKSRFQLGRSTA